MGGIKDRLTYLLKHNKKFQYVYKTTFSALFRFWGAFIRTDDNLVLINNFAGLRYSDSPKALFEYIKSIPELQSLRIVWAFIDVNKFRCIDGCEIVKQDSFKYFITALKAKYWISNVNIERGLHFKKKKTLYLNTWHGMPFKKIGNSVKGRNDYNCDNVDFWCAESDYSADIYIKAFNVLPDAILKCGLPRNDRLYHITPQQIEELKEKMGLPLNKKIISYVPTWRDSKDGGKHYDFSFPINLEKWEEKLSMNYILLFRAHHFTNHLSNLKEDGFIKDYSDYPDINDIFIVSDIMISDYSASMADYAILERPIISFGYDYDDYDVDRGFYEDLDKVTPNGVMRTEDQVLNHILTMNYKEECHKTKTMIKDKYVTYGGNATATCVEKLFSDYFKVQN